MYVVEMQGVTIFGMFNAMIVLRHFRILIQSKKHLMLGTHAHQKKEVLIMSDKKKCCNCIHYSVCLEHSEFIMRKFCFIVGWKAKNCNHYESKERGEER
jgi:hypothetical protein